MSVFDAPWFDPSNVLPEFDVGTGESCNSHPCGQVIAGAAAAADGNISRSAMSMAEKAPDNPNNIVFNFVLDLTDSTEFIVDADACCPSIPARCRFGLKGTVALSPAA